jgi:hypothetical protein
LLQADGRVAFLDFGLFKRMASASVHTELACLRATSEGRADELHCLKTQLGVFPQPELIKPEEMLSFVRDAVGWYLTDEEVEATPELATDAFIASVDPRSPHFRKLRWQHLPSEHAFARRVELYTFGLLGQLRARVNWHRIAREWLYGEPAISRLGRQELAWRNEFG